jgi:hypothetical protein
MQQAGLMFERHQLSWHDRHSVTMDHDLQDR